MSGGIEIWRQTPRELNDYCAAAPLMAVETDRAEIRMLMRRQIEYTESNPNSLIHKFTYFPASRPHDPLIPTIYDLYFESAFFIISQLSIFNSQLQSLLPFTFLLLILLYKLLETGLVA